MLLYDGMGRDSRKELRIVLCVLAPEIVVKARVVFGPSAIVIGEGGGVAVPLSRCICFSSSFGCFCASVSGSTTDGD